MKADQDRELLSIHAWFLVLVTIMFAVLALSWMVPFRMNPNIAKDYNLNEGLRMVRSLAPFLLLFLSRLKLSYQWAMSPIAFLALFVFWVFPMISSMLAPTSPFMTYSTWPLLLSGCMFIICQTLRRKTIDLLLIVTGLTAFVIITNQTIFEGLGYNTYFLRNRALFGFFHPIAAASAVASSLFGFLLLLRRYSHQFSRNFYFFLSMILIALHSSLLVMIDSRNIFIFCILPLVMSLIPSAIWTKLQKYRWFLVTFIIAIPILLYACSIFGNLEKPPGSFFNSLVSGRLGTFQVTLREYFNNGSMSSIGPSDSATLSVALMQSAWGHAESVFICYLLNNGMLPTVCLFLFIIFIGARSVKMGRSAFGLWAGIVLVFAFDSQGLTSSNFILFLVLCCLAGADSSLVEDPWLESPQLQIRNLRVELKKIANRAKISSEQGIGPKWIKEL